MRCRVGCQVPAGALWAGLRVELQAGLSRPRDGFWWVLPSVGCWWNESELVVGGVRWLLG